MAKDPKNKSVGDESATPEVELVDGRSAFEDALLGDESAKAVEVAGEAADGDEALATDEALAAEGAAAGGGATDDGTPANLGAIRYVHAALFAAGMLIAYLSGKILTGIWSWLADWQDVVQALPFLLQYGEDSRGTITMLAGAVIGVLVVVQSYRREKVRQWANDVALELSRVSWPNREDVQNGTIVVLVAGAVATIYVTILDRFWGFISQLVYGA